MYVARVPNRNSPPAFLLREAYREDGKVKNRTLANISHWPPQQIEALRQVLKGNTQRSPRLKDAFAVVRSLPHGHVAAVLGMMRQLKLEQLLEPGPQRARVLALIAQRVLAPGSKLAAARALHSATAHSTLGEELGVSTVDEDDLYAALDWLVPQQAAIEADLARRHLGQGNLVLYDVSSSYFEGHCCPLARYGHWRDERRGNPQIVFGVLADAQGCPVAVEVFAGNTADPTTVAAQIGKLRERFGLEQVVLVGDRGMLTQARIEQELRPLPGLAWITALRSGQIHKRWPTARCSSRCSIPPTWPKSRIPIILASAWWCVAIRCWHRSGRASARS